MEQKVPNEWISLNEVRDYKPENMLKQRKETKLNGSCNKQRCPNVYVTKLKQKLFIQVRGS